jgi:NAD(P)-dependent dehydrogenase (short-subunit alcohol dehydrogenase family)
VTTNAVLVTGASTGIGRATALMMVRNGWHVYAGVRSDEAAHKLSEVDGVTPLRLDITDADQIAAARREITELTGLVNNAGTTLPCPVEYLPLEEFRRQLEVNLVGHVAVIQAFLPVLRRPGGRIVNISSPGARIGAPFMAGYVAAKGGLEAVSGTLRNELGRQGIDVAIIEPGFVSTTMRHKLDRDTARILAELPEAGRATYGRALKSVMATVAEEAAHGDSPDVVADAIRRALTDKRPRTVYPAGARAGRVLMLARLLPDRARDRIVGRMIKIDWSAA